ncbi:MAG: glycosyl hydrolase [Thermoleophilia bacterium]
MLNRATIRTSIVLAVFSVLLLSLAFAGHAMAQTAPATPTFKLGVFLPNPGNIGKFESQTIQHRTDIFLWYQAVGEQFNSAQLGPVAAGGRTIQLAWEPHDPMAADAVNQPAYRLKNITRGDFDNDIRRWARDLKSFGYPVIIRPMCEMNGDWTSWGGTVNGNVPADYIPAWRHMHDVFVQEGVTNVKWVWSPNMDESAAGASDTFNTYYPGDDYVDYVGINGYNWGTSVVLPYWSSSWQTFTRVFQYSYDELATRTAKPIMITEMGSTELGGSKAAWTTDMFSTLKTRFPRVVSLTWFNINKETDWRIQSSTRNLRAFRKAILTMDNYRPLYLQ